MKRRTQTNPNSLANLKPWKPGESGNLSGLPANFRSPSTWLRGLCSWSEPDLEVLIGDKTEPATKRAAAQIIIDSLTGNADERRRAYAELSDRVEGRSRQTAVIEINKPQPTTQELLDQYYRRTGYVPSVANTDDADVASSMHVVEPAQGDDTGSENTDTPPNDPTDAVSPSGEEQ